MDSDNNNTTNDPVSAAAAAAAAAYASSFTVTDALEKEKERRWQLKDTPPGLDPEMQENDTRLQVDPKATDTSTQQQTVNPYKHPNLESFPDE
ncbi:hypothetical protein BGX33_005861 [Mortierella sp. NVP41]|nr:hypothetical protein BGX33_005861 [Mortierella sp. NVP41]